MRTNTKKFKLLCFIGENKGVRYMDIERFICTLNGYDYDKKFSRTENGKWQEVDGKYAFVRYEKPKVISIRSHKGIWSTNLNGRAGILQSFCKKINGKWYLTHNTAHIVVDFKHSEGQSGIVYDESDAVGPLVVNYPFLRRPTCKTYALGSRREVPVSSLEAELPSDEIKGNSKVISVEHIKMPFSIPAEEHSVTCGQHQNESKNLLQRIGDMDVARLKVVELVAHGAKLQMQQKAAAQALAEHHQTYIIAMGAVVDTETAVRTLLNL